MTGHVCTGQFVGPKPDRDKSQNRVMKVTPDKTVQFSLTLFGVAGGQALKDWMVSLHPGPDLIARIGGGNPKVIL